MDIPLDKNAFYIQLLTKFKRWYDEAADKRWIVCVPAIHQSCSFKRALDEHLITAHLLKKSPLLKDHYISLNRKLADVDIEIEGNMMYLVGKKGQQAIRILSQELAYNSRNEQYKILILEKPIINFTIDTPVIDSSQRFSRMTTFLECKDLLKYISIEVTRNFEEKIQELTNTYIFCPRFSKDAADKLKAICDWAIARYQQVRPKLFIKEEWLYPKLRCAAESVANGLVYEKVFHVLKQENEKDDKEFYQKSKSLGRQKVTPCDFGAQEIFRSFSTNPSIDKELKELDAKMTPLEKLASLKRVIDLINEQLNVLIKLAADPFHTSHCVMADDLLSTTVTVLTLNPMPHFISNLRYMEIFGWELPSKDEMGYSHVTFLGASKIIFPEQNSYLYDNPADEYTNHQDNVCQRTCTVFKVPNESNHRDPLHRNKSRSSYPPRGQKSIALAFAFDNGQSSSSSLTSSSSSSPGSRVLDRQLDKIINQIEASRLKPNQTQSQQQYPSPSLNSRGSSNRESSHESQDLGDFISNLMSQRYVKSGKQT